MVCKAQREEVFESKMSKERLRAMVFQKVPSSKMKEIMFRGNLPEDHLTKKTIPHIQGRLLAKPAGLNESEDKIFKYKIKIYFFKKPIGSCFITQEIGTIFTE